MKKEKWMKRECLDEERVKDETMKEEMMKEDEQVFKERFAHLMDAVEPGDVRRERVWRKVSEKRQTGHGFALRFACAFACALVVCVLGAAGANAATDGAFLESVRRFCGLSERQQEVAKETIRLPNEVYASELVACSAKYIVFANERGLMVYDREQEMLISVLDLQELECNYFNADTMATRIYMQEDVIYIFNQKKSGKDECMSYEKYNRQEGEMPEEAYCYNLALAGQEDALTKITEKSVLADIYAGWQDYAARCIRDTFDEMQGKPLDINEMFGKGEINYSRNCLIWEGADGTKNISFLMVRSADGAYILCTRPVDGMTLEEYALTIETESADAVSQEEQKLPPFQYTGEDEILRALCNEMKKKEQFYALEEGGVFIPAPLVLASIADGEDIVVFCNLSLYGYYRNGNTLNCESGGGSAARLRLSPSPDGGYVVTECLEAGDGGDYGRDIQAFCEGYPVSPEIFHTDGSDRELIRRELIRMYVQDNGLDIRYYKDFGWDPCSLD